MNSIKRYHGTLVGVAVGDSLGMPVEGWKREQIRDYIGRINEFIDPVEAVHIFRERAGEEAFAEQYKWKNNFQKHEITDDTILTRALAQSIAQKGFSLTMAAEMQLWEYIIRKNPDGTVDGGFGGTTRDAFKNLESGISPYASGVIGGPGNAPPMKMSPVGLYMDACEKYDEGIVFAELVGKMTHLDPRSIAGGIVQAHAVYALLQNQTREQFLNGIVEV